jgi:DnaB helicase-like protein
MTDEAEHGLLTEEIERLLLAGLCAPLDRKTRTEILDCLAAHTFASADHGIIFQALAKLPDATSEYIRETLYARLTRLGFPDIDLEPILKLEPPSAKRIKALLQQLSR